MKNKVSLAAIVLFFSTIHFCFAQTSFIPKSLGSGINSPADEVNPVPSPDGKTLYFTRLNHPENAGGPKNSADIWFTTVAKDGSFSTPQHAMGLNTGKYNSALSFSAQGKQILFYSDNALYISSKNGDTWGTPEKLNLKAGKDAQLSDDGMHLLFSKGGNIMIASRIADGTWTKPVSIPLPVKKKEAPFLLPDNKTLFFAASSKGKKHDLYKTERTGADWSTWSIPVALNDNINTVDNETGLKTNALGSWGFFSTTTLTTGKADLYRVKLFEDNPFVEVSGKVINAVTKRPLHNKATTFMANGKSVDSVALNKDSASYRVKLPFGKKYELYAVIDHYKAYPFAIDATGLNEFTSITTNLEEGPVPYILLKGKFLIKNTDKFIPAQAKPSIIIDGESVDSATIDNSTGTYSIKLNHGSMYYVQVSANHFESFPEMVDLTTFDGYEEVTLNLQADAEKMAVITGRIIDKQTGNPPPSTLAMTIKVEGIESLYSSIDSLLGNYDLRLPLKEVYTISVSSPGYYPVYETVDVKNEKEEIKISKDLTEVPVKKGESVLLKNIFFTPRKTTLTEASNPDLDRLVDFLTKNPEVQIEVGGFSQKAVKTSTLNAARAVQKYIVSKGISATRVTARGHGSVKTTTWDGLEGQSLKIEFTFTKVE